MISIIAAMDRNRLIGKDNTLPWRLPADLAHFKQVTMGKPIIMGRKTWDSLGRPLPGRTNVVVTRDRDFSAAGCVVVHSMDEALTAADGHEEIMIIGGSSFYEQALPLADRMYLTVIDDAFEGDAWFPDYDTQQWQVITEERHGPDEKNAHSYTFLQLDRVR